MDGIQPEAVDAEPGQVVQPAGEPGEITDTVAVGVLERLDVQAVDDCLLVPALGHVASLSPSQPWQNASRACSRVVGSRFPISLYKVWRHQLGPPRWDKDQTISYSGGGCRSAPPGGQPPLPITYRERVRGGI